MMKFLAFLIVAITHFSVPTNAAPSEQKEDCSKSCINTMELFPVCGSDGITYSNPGALRCAKECKSDLEQVSIGSCEENATTSGSVPINTAPPQEKEQCDIPCGSTLEIFPVCGSDGLTYVNPGDLKCAKNCKHDLEQVKVGPCQEDAKN